MKKIAIALMTVFTLSLASVAYAADNGTEFGIEDDLTVLGTGGTQADPDVDVKGFSVFGSTQSAQALSIPVAPGNIFVNGYVQVSSGLYVVGGSTFAAGGAYFTGVSSFSNVANIHIAGGTANQVLKKVAGGGMVWANDSVGLDAASMGDPRYLQMPNAGETALENSSLRQDDGQTSITLMNSSSMTVTGAFGVRGASRLDGAVTLSTNTSIAGALTLYDNLSVSSNAVVAGTLGVTGASSLSTLGTSGLATLNSASVTTTLGVTGAATLSNNLTVNGNAKLGDAVTDIHGVNMNPEADVALAVNGDGTAASGKYAAKFYSGGSLAAWIKKK